MSERTLSDKPMAVYMREYNRRIKAGEHTVKPRKPRADTSPSTEAQSSPVVPALSPDGYPV